MFSITGLFQVLQGGGGYLWVEQSWKTIYGELNVWGTSMGCNNDGGYSIGCNHYGRISEYRWSVTIMGDAP